MFIIKKVLEEQKEKIEKLEEEMDLIEEKEFEAWDIANTFFEDLEEMKLSIIDKDEKIDKIQSEKNILKEEIKNFENIFRKSKQNWYINIDIAWRINPITKKQEQYKIPLNFEKKNVYNLVLSDDLKGLSFKYKGDRFSDNVYEIPRSLGEQLEIVDQIKNILNQEKIDANNINDFKDIIEFLKSRGINTDIDYWKLSIDFLSYHRDAEFNTGEYVKICKFNNRETPRKCLNKLIEYGLIKRVKKGVYKVLFYFE